MKAKYKSEHVGGNMRDYPSSLLVQVKMIHLMNSSSAFYDANKIYYSYYHPIHHILFHLSVTDRTPYENNTLVVEEEVALLEHIVLLVQQNYSSQETHLQGSSLFQCCPDWFSFRRLCKSLPRKAHWL